MLPLIPLVSLAAGLVPELIGLFGGHRAGEVAGKVADVVRDVTGTTDPAKAAAIIESDPAEAKKLQVRLTEVQQEYLKLQMQDAQNERESLLAMFKAETEDRSRASSTMVSALAIRDWPGKLVAISPAIVSAIVIIGFFVFTVWMVRSPIAPADTQAMALLNVVVGALVAGFTAVINFWLGSSQGSRDKDVTVAALQQAQAAQAAQTVRDVTAASALVSARSAVAPAQAPSGPIPGVPSRFDLCFAEILEKEGGFSNNPNDPGGPTNLGITQRTLAAWRQAEVTVEDVQKLAREEACEIYRSNYWNVMRCDDLPKGVDLSVFDFGVNAGSAAAVRLLQKVAGAEQDGSVGPLTLRAVRSSEPRTLIEALTSARLDFYRGLATYETFGKGWEKRCAEIRAKALGMCVA